MYYAKNGDEITMEQWGKLLGDMEYKRVGEDHLPDGRWISTVWLGLDHSWALDGPDTPILIFETMVFDGDSFADEYVERYTTEQQAIEGHARIVEMVKTLTNLEVHDDEQSAGSDAGSLGETRSDSPEHEEGAVGADAQGDDECALHVQRREVDPE